MQRRVTLKDIAKELNVSVTTISKAINNHPDISASRRKQIMSLLAERNYIPNYSAKNLRCAKTRFISLIVSDNANPYFAKVIKGVEHVLSNNGYHTLIVNNNEDPEKELTLVREMLSINVAGVLICPANGSRKGVELLRENEIPHVLITRYIDKGHDNYVVADDEKAGYIGTKHLIETHGEHVVFFNHYPGISTTHDRLQGYRRALEEAGIPFREEYVLHKIRSQEDGFHAAEQMLKAMGDKRFSILCYSDFAATGAMLCVQESGRKIPEDVSILGIDGVEMFSYFYPGLSSVHLPKFDLGVKSAELLVDLIKRASQREEEEEDLPEEPEFVQIVLEPSLQERATTM